MTISSVEADRMMNFAAFIYLRNSGSLDVDETTRFARKMFKEFCAIEGITDVDETDKEEDTNEEENDCDGNCDECDEHCFSEEPDNLEVGFNPYTGGYDYDC